MNHSCFIVAILFFPESDIDIYAIYSEAHIHVNPQMGILKHLNRLIFAKVEIYHHYGRAFLPEQFQHLVGLLNDITEWIFSNHRSLVTEDRSYLGELAYIFPERLEADVRMRSQIGEHGVSNLSCKIIYGQSHLLSIAASHTDVFIVTGIYQTLVKPHADKHFSE